jgi:Type IV secretion system pilin
MIPFVDIAYAAPTDMTAFAKIVDPLITHIVNPIVLLMFAVAIIVFVWGVIEMIIYGDDSGARDTGRNHMLAGITGIAIMLSAWGIVYFISNTISNR